MISIVRIAAVVFALFAGSRAVLRFKSREISHGELGFWSIIWIALILLALFPQKSVDIADVLGIQRGVDIFVYSGITVLFYLVFRIYVRLDKFDHQLTKIVREIAKKK